jgi:tetratricopeptide (TPR) repeat protein
MLRAFIVRPFGIKNDIDFNRVEAELIDPALAAAGYDGRTTGEILRQGNIRTDMFQRLLTADLVVADLSIHNANVFYELGIRHSLREKRTFLLRSEASNYPFDLQTDRYFVYDKDNPAASLPLLIKALEQTKASPDQDSPVFRSLPNMKAQDRSKFLAVPMGFAEEVEIAAAGKQLGDLELLAAEAGSFDWGIEGLRLVGRAQFKLKALEGARDTWEAVRNFDSDDLEANTLLGTIYQRLGDLTRSDLAIKRALKRAEMAGWDKAEALSLMARNAKANWRNEWKDLAPEKQREAALRSRYLEDSLNAYRDGFEEALNHFYSGLNALGMLKVQIDLATALPDVWAEQFDEEEEAERDLAKRQEEFRKLAAAVEVSIDAAQKRLARERKTDIWVNISEADLCCLTSDRPKRVSNAYRKALAGAPDFASDAARGQLELYKTLGVLPENVAAALGEIPAASQPRPRQERPRVLLFTGHVIDKPGRETPRFPPDKEDAARQALRKAIEEEQALGPIAHGIAGGASGGDLLFHEVCAELGVPTQLFLALPREEYIVESVQSAGPKWVERFNRLYDKKEEGKERRVLSTSKDLPAWLVERADEYSIWQRNNLWMLHNALAEQGQEVTLIALWDGKGQGDGPGGTADLVEQAQKRGAKFVHLPTNELFGINP